MSRTTYTNYVIEDTGMVSLIESLIVAGVDPSRIVPNTTAKNVFDELSKRGIKTNDTITVTPNYKGVDLFVLTADLAAVDEAYELKTHKAKFKNNGKTVSNTLLLNGTNSACAVLGLTRFYIVNGVIVYENALTHDELNMLTYPAVKKALSATAPTEEEKEWLEFPIVCRALRKLKDSRQQNVRLVKYYAQEELLEDHGYLDMSRVTMYDNRFNISGRAQ